MPEYNLIFHVIVFLVIRSGTKLYGQVVGIPMGTNFAPMVADLFLFYYERLYDASLWW